MIKPFHLSFVVPQLREAEDFYVDILGCKKGRDQGTWIDIIFHGHQLTLHQQTETMPSKSIDHFGIILDKSEWSALYTKLQSHNVSFALEPKAAVHEDKSESGKFVIMDPANNLLEFKFYKASPVELKR